MSEHRTLADELRPIGMTPIWVVTFFVVAILGGFFTPWETIERLIASRGVGEEEAALLAFIAGYTLPLTVGFGVIAFVALTGVANNFHPGVVAFGAALILLLSGRVAGELGLGLLPDYERLPYTAKLARGPKPWPAQAGIFLLATLEGYFNTYGWPLMICALFIGGAGAIQVERWFHQVSQPGE